MNLSLSISTSLCVALAVLITGHNWIAALLLGGATMGVMYHMEANNG